MTPSLAAIALILPHLLPPTVVHPCVGFSLHPPLPSPLRSRIRPSLAGRAAGRGGGGGGGGFGRSSPPRGGGEDDYPRKKKKNEGTRDAGKGAGGRYSSSSVGFLGELSLQEEGMSSASPKVTLDRFGFPPPTEEDVFPPLPNDVIRIPVDNYDYDRANVAHATCRHLGVNLDAFDDAGRSVHEEGGEDGNYDDGNGTRWSLRMIHVDPPVFLIDDFLTPSECDSLSSLVDENDRNVDDDRRVRKVRSPTFSSSSHVTVSRRTSTTWFCRYDAVPTFLAKATRLLDVDLDRMEEPQVVRYRPGEEFSYHYDEVPRSGLHNGGQRLATLLVYLNDLEDGRGGGTAFRDLLDGMDIDEDERRRRRLVVTPKRGTALLFYPAYEDGTPDARTLHRGEVALDDKVIAQIWIHERSYEAGTPEGNRQSDAMDGVKNEARRLGFS
jgi:prolyl 4-hydroxylase